ncbi:hypothetical protein Tco_1037080 [Tanacetum coccineum]
MCYDLEVTRPSLNPLRPNLRCTDDNSYDMSSDDDNDDDEVEKDEEDEEEEEHLAPADPSTVPTDDPVPSS